MENDIANYNRQYFRPSPLPALNTRNFNFEFLDKYSNENPSKIILPNWLFTSPKDTLINYFSILREASNISKGGCGTIGNSKYPYPVAYNFLTSKYKSNLDYKTYLNFFYDIGHINLIKLHNITVKNTPEGTYDFFVEIETIEPSTKGNTSFAYYYGFIHLENENGNYKISNMDFSGEDFLCAPYHFWQHNAELYVDTVYGNWCKLLKRRYPTNQDGYVKNIYIDGTDGKQYLFQFFQLTNGTDVEIHQFVKNANNQWEAIKIDPNKCLEK